MKIKPVVFSWDFGVGVVLFLLSYFFLPKPISVEIVLTLYQTGITVLSIIFSIFFAALAIIISSPVDQFIEFMEENGGYTNLVNMYKWTLGALFIGLVYSIMAYLISSYLKTEYPDTFNIQDTLIPTAFIFIFSYSVTSAFIRAMDSVKFADFRTKFILRKKELERGEN